MHVLCKYFLAIFGKTLDISPFSEREQAPGFRLILGFTGLAVVAGAFKEDFFFSFEGEKYVKFKEGG